MLVDHSIWPTMHVDVIKWKHFPRYWPYVPGIHRSPVNCPHTGQWRGVLIFSLIWARINGWVNNRNAGELRRHRAQHDVIVMGNSGSGFYLKKSLVITMYCACAGVVYQAIAVRIERSFFYIATVKCACKEHMVSSWHGSAFRIRWGTSE